MKTRHWLRSLLAAGGALALGVLVIWLAWYLVCGLHSVEMRERLDPIAAVLGGIIGALGVTAAVYLTLQAQRRDDAEKMEAALRAEVAEFGRIAVKLLVLSQEIEAGEVTIPRRDLPAVMAMPEPRIYNATADRISRLEHGPLLVTLHARIAEAVSLAGISAASVRPVSGMAQPEPSATKEQGQTFGAAWFDVCAVAASVLAKTPDARAHAELLVQTTLKDLDQFVFASAERYLHVSRE